ncbi:putative Iron-sulfur assembly protein 1 [Trypanosoma cruzi]|uniref:Iron-sulfur assembly protein 1 n=2 Tax=Trypanosoma cruzi TaxID=5693 RepID=Q4DPM6_TRYCC|nr:hypothetical protein, conserved [Trypanosoma cruzi]EAN94480.1 hypothetical protein, conserved [Trypanosoma cruzi]PWV08441.1 putative Iron-sulfur assembly protein 1 [Trypanosoma cruzi]|eukprot:XP_816331.1 hypothetical protein [Trypanosoma cruzi strain CL Brener]
MRRAARVCGIATTSSFLPRVIFLWCNAMQHRCHTSSYTSATTTTTTTTTASTDSNAGRSHDAKGSVQSPMPYKSTHKGSGKAASPLRNRGCDKHAAKDTAAPSSSLPHAGVSAAGAHAEANGSEASARQENLAASRSSCTEDAGVVSSRPLSPLQRRQLLFRHKAAFTLTPQALRRVKYLLKRCHEDPEHQHHPKMPDGIRIGVSRRGCSGYSYTVKYHYPEDEKMPPKETDKQGTRRSHGNNGDTSSATGMHTGDVVVLQDGVKVVVDSNALFYVIGTEMDYVTRSVEEKFTFRNPNQKYSCGCEESFMPFDLDEQEAK